MISRENMVVEKVFRCNFIKKNWSHCKLVLAFYQKPISYTIRYVHWCISDSSYLINYMHHNIYLHKLSKHVWKTTNTCTCNFLLLYFPLLIVYNAIVHTSLPNLIKVEIDWRHRITMCLGIDLKNGFAVHNFFSKVICFESDEIFLMTVLIKNKQAATW